MTTTTTSIPTNEDTTTTTTAVLPTTTTALPTTTTVLPTAYNITVPTDYDFIENITNNGLLDDIEEIFEETTTLADVSVEKPKGLCMRADEIAIAVALCLLALLLMIWAAVKSYKIGSNEKKLRKTIESIKKKRLRDPKSIHEARELTEDVMATGPMNDPLVDVGALPIPPLMKPKKKPKRPRRARTLMSESSRPEASAAPNGSPPKAQSCPTAFSPSQPSRPNASPAPPSTSPVPASTAPADTDIFDPTHEVSCIGEVDVEPKK